MNADRCLCERTCDLELVRRVCACADSADADGNIDTVAECASQLRPDSDRLFEVSRKLVDSLDASSEATALVADRRAL